MEKSSIDMWKLKGDNGGTCSSGTCKQDAGGSATATATIGALLASLLEHHAFRGVLEGVGLPVTEDGALRFFGTVFAFLTAIVLLHYALRTYDTTKDARATSFIPNDLRVASCYALCFAFEFVFRSVSLLKQPAGTAWWDGGAGSFSLLANVVAVGLCAPYIVWQAKQYDSDYRQLLRKFWGVMTREEAQDLPLKLAGAAAAITATFCFLTFYLSAGFIRPGLTGRSSLLMLVPAVHLWCLAFCWLVCVPDIDLPSGRVAGFRSTVQPCHYQLFSVITWSVLAYAELHEPRVGVWHVFLLHVGLPAMTMWVVVQMSAVAKTWYDTRITSAEEAKQVALLSKPILLSLQQCMEILDRNH